jgi:hypothetical protein
VADNVLDEILVRSWQDAKERERAAQEERREIEDEILRRLALAPDAEGTHRFGALRVVCRTEAKVDADAAQALAAEFGLEEQLARLFRWKPELRAKEWATAHERIQRAFSPAITVRAGRPSFSVKEQEESK